jgi:hypothetical protein
MDKNRAVSGYRVVVDSGNCRRNLVILITSRNIATWLGTWFFESKHSGRHLINQIFKSYWTFFDFILRRLFRLVLLDTTFVMIPIYKKLLVKIKKYFCNEPRKLCAVGHIFGLPVEIEMTISITMSEFIYKFV